MDKNVCIITCLHCDQWRIWDSIKVDKFVKRSLTKSASLIGDARHMLDEIDEFFGAYIKGCQTVFLFFPKAKKRKVSSLNTNGYKCVYY